jgi:hypothetical protein
LLHENLRAQKTPPTDFGATLKMCNFQIENSRLAFRSGGAGSEWNLTRLTQNNEGFGNSFVVVVRLNSILSLRRSINDKQGLI